MALENKHNPWYLIDGSPLTVEEIESFKNSRAWKALCNGANNQILAIDATRDESQIEHGVERHLSGQSKAFKWFIHWPEITRSLWNHFEAPEKIWAEIEDDLHGGLKMERVQLNGDRVAERAAGLLKGWLGCWPKLRSLDAMHVAAAVELGAKTFLSFDSRSCQRVLAQTQRLKAWPALTSEELALLR